MDSGHIVEIGKHDELMAQKGAYWRLYEAQARQAENERAVFDGHSKDESSTDAE
jgi:ATP-binding cassette subfamily B protein